MASMVDIEGERCGGREAKEGGRGERREEEGSWREKHNTLESQVDRFEVASGERRKKRVTNRASREDFISSPRRRWKRKYVSLTVTSG